MTDDEWDAMPTEMLDLLIESTLVHIRRTKAGVSLSQESQQAIAGFVVFGLRRFLSTTPSPH